MSDRLLDATELAELLGLPSAQAVYQIRYATPKDLPPAITIGGRRVRWLKSSVFDWLRAREERRDAEQAA